MSKSEEANKTEELNLGSQGAGEDCFGKVIQYGGTSTVAGQSVHAETGKVDGVLYLECVSRWSHWVCGGLLSHTSA